MKKVLFATTALVATAGVAAADVSLSGSAEMGIFGGDTITAAGAITNRETQFHQDIEVTFTLSGATDNGLSFGASIQLDEASWTDSADDGGTTVFISGDFGRLTMGDTDGGFDWAMGEVNLAAGSLDDSETAHAGFNGNSGLDGTYDGQVLRYDYSVAGFGVAVSVELDDQPAGGNDDPVIGLGFTYSGDMNGIGYRAGVGYQTRSTAAGIETTIIGGSFGVTAGDLQVALNLSEQTVDGNANDQSHWAIGVGYTMDAWSFGANYGEYENRGNVANRDIEGYGVAVAYDLGGGAALQFGASSSDVTNGGVTRDASQWSFGVSMSF
ncbi:porin [Roseicyclus marinus]|uniref:Porin n=1 Tax=Roseicyclus marinus TaxID=2161673 RepID=A0AA48H013_9RHOB|nr:porin [Roseicyclus marinus]